MYFSPLRVFITPPDDETMRRLRCSWDDDLTAVFLFWFPPSLIALVLTFLIVHIYVYMYSACIMGGSSHVNIYMLYTIIVPYHMQGVHIIHTYVHAFRILPPSARSIMQMQFYALLCSPSNATLNHKWKEEEEVGEEKTKVKKRR